MLGKVSLRYIHPASVFLMLHHVECLHLSGNGTRVLNICKPRAQVQLMKPHFSLLPEQEKWSHGFFLFRMIYYHLLKQLSQEFDCIVMTEGGTHGVGSLCSVHGSAQD